jgi:hypothetical protein
MRARILVLALALSAMTLLGSVEAATAGLFGGCVGDCNDDQQVTVDELVLGVRIALGTAPESACEQGGPGFSISGLTTAVANTLYECARLRDFADSSAFTLAQQGYFGFCPQIGDLYTAHIQPSDGGWVLARQLIATGTRGVDQCIDDEFGTSSRCFVASPLPCRLLTLSELEALRIAFAEVKIWTGPDAFCVHGVADPCLVTAMQWDDLATTDFIHSSDRLDRAEVPRIVELVQSLGEGPETSCPQQ